ncbi:hypothetical protein BD289DRAFT_483050 [Coniella lustricola]|uniref:AN1-type domain-containing protein n=1 Tax=Coniella lustricola TaxID=2025994 RepID=A0A2T3A6S2_9PEZI|nr:hypothetical protein BD289DRAFT_483050 [Coniella lustricola]
MAKPRCPAVIEGKECRKLAHPIVGKCDDCSKLFCSAHRFMEEHNCVMADVTKTKLFQENAQQLLKERTQVVRI